MVTFISTTLTSTSVFVAILALQAPVLADLSKALFDEDKDETANNDRLLDIIQVLCGDECDEDELIVMGTGEVIPPARIDNRPGVENSHSSTTRDYVAMFARFLGILTVSVALALLAPRLLLLLRRFMSFLLHTISHMSGSLRKRSFVAQKKAGGGDSKPILTGEDEQNKQSVPKLPCDGNGNKGHQDSNGFASSPISHLSEEIEVGVETSHDVRTTLNDKQSSMRHFPITSEANDTCSSSLRLMSENQLKQHGQEVAHSMSVLMSEFETTMSGQGYTVSQSESLLIASQQLLSIEALHAAKAKEARHYMYDAQQRQSDRSIAERRHSETIQAREQEGGWFQKLRQARDDCVTSVFPAMQRSWLILMVCSGAYFVFQYQHLISLDNPGEILLQWQTGNEMHGPSGDVNFHSGVLLPWLGFVSPLRSFLSRLWIVAVMPILGLALYAAVQLLLPSMVVQFGKTVLVASLFVWLTSNAIPWESLCFGQLAFWVLAQVWIHVAFQLAFRELSRLDSCPTNKDLVPHLSLFDQTAQSMPYLASVLNIFIWSYSRQGKHPSLGIQI